MIDESLKIKTVYTETPRYDLGKRDKRLIMKAVMIKIFQMLAREKHFVLPTLNFVFTVTSKPLSETRFRFLSEEHKDAMLIKERSGCVDGRIHVEMLQGRQACSNDNKYLVYFHPLNRLMEDTIKEYADSECREGRRYFTVPFVETKNTRRADRIELWRSGIKDALKKNEVRKY